MKINRPLPATLWLLVVSLALLTSSRVAFGKEGVRRTKGPANAEPLRFSLIDQLPSQGGATTFNSIEESRRFSVFNDALQDVVRAGKLEPAILINSELDLRSGTGSEKPQPKGAKIVRVFLTQWAQTRLGGVADSEIVCRFEVEEVRDGRRLHKLGPFFSRVRDDVALSTSDQSNLASYRAAARESLTELAAVLPR